MARTLLSLHTIVEEAYPQKAAWNLYNYRNTDKYVKWPVWIDWLYLQCFSWHRWQYLWKLPPASHLIHLLARWVSLSPSETNLLIIIILFGSVCYVLCLKTKGRDSVLYYTHCYKYNSTQGSSPMCERHSLQINRTVMGLKQFHINS